MLSTLSFSIFQNADLLNLLIITIIIYIIMHILLSDKRWFRLTFITAAFFALSIYNLGSFSLPVSAYDPKDDNSWIILRADGEFNKIYTISGEGDNNANNGKYQIYYRGVLIEGSNDNISYEAITTLEKDDFFKYLITDTSSYEYIRLTFPDHNGVMNEIWAVNNDTPVNLEIIDASGMDEAIKVIDEQECFVSDPTYMNETYFDEIYHVRNAFEIANGQKMYTAVHPLLGTEIIASGIKIFGMNPFGFRIMGVIFSTMLIPMIYFLIREFTSEKWAIYGSLLFAFDFMHYTTGRIATLEPFSVFFITGMFLFMIKAIKHNYIHDSKKHYRYLFLSGLFMSLAISVKWTGCYAAIGIALIYFIYNIQVFIKEDDIKLRNYRTIELFLLSVLFFILMPIIIYTISFLPVPMYYGGWHSLSEFISQVIEYNTYMFNYHTGLESTHPFSSKWHQWLFDIRPIWYYVKRGNDYIMTISCMNNPLINIAGVIAVIYSLYKTLAKRNKTYLILLIMYFANLIPWMFVDRTTFAYHYYPCIPFLILILTYSLYDLSHKNRTFKNLMLAIIIVSGVLFIMFLPVIGGFRTSYFYVQKFLKWLPTWYFG